MAEETSNEGLPAPSESPSENPSDPDEGTLTLEQMRMIDLTSDVVESKVDFSGQPEYDNNGELVGGDPDFVGGEGESEGEAPEAQATQETEGDETPDEDLTDSMRDRVTKLKQKAEEAGKEKDAKIEQQEFEMEAMGRELDGYRKMVEDYNEYISNINVVQGDTDALSKEIDAIEAEIDERGDEMTQVELRKLDRRQSALEKQISDVNQSKRQIRELGNKQEVLRAESDRRAMERYPFLSQKDSAEYKALREVAYPTLQQLVPNFERLPYDMPIAAELAQMIVDSQKYRKITGKSKNASRKAPPKHLSTGDQKVNISPRGKGRYNKNSLVKRMRDGSLSPEEVLTSMGVGWFHNK